MRWTKKVQATGWTKGGKVDNGKYRKNSYNKDTETRPGQTRGLTVLQGRSRDGLAGTEHARGEADYLLHP